MAAVDFVVILSRLQALWTAGSSKVISIIACAKTFLIFLMASRLEVVTGPMMPVDEHITIFASRVESGPNE